MSPASVSWRWWQLGVLWIMQSSREINRMFQNSLSAHVSVGNYLPASLDVWPLPYVPVIQCLLLDNGNVGTDYLSGSLHGVIRQLLCFRRSFVFSLFSRIRKKAKHVLFSFWTQPVPVLIRQGCNDVEWEKGLRVECYSFMDDTKWTEKAKASKPVILKQEIDTTLESLSGFFFV